MKTSSRTIGIEIHRHWVPPWHRPLLLPSSYLVHSHWRTNLSACGGRTSQAALAKQHLRQRPQQAKTAKRFQSAEHCVPKSMIAMNNCSSQPHRLNSGWSNRSGIISGSHMLFQKSDIRLNNHIHNSRMIETRYVAARFPRRSDSTHHVTFRLQQSEMSRVLQTRWSARLLCDDYTQLCGETLLPWHSGY